jgi:hypothetical protein
MDIGNSRLLAAPCCDRDGDDIAEVRLTIERP